jgi:two-component system response regulator NreC
MNLKIMLADDHKVLLEGLNALISRIEGLSVAGTAFTGHEALRLADEIKPDIVIMDIAMPGMNGIEATRRMLSNHPEIKVIALSVHSEGRYVMEMIRAGASGYVLKECAFEEIHRAIGAVVDHQAYLSPGVTREVFRGLSDPEAEQPESAFTLLSSREREILQLLAEGKTVREVADTINLSIKTVDTHKQNAMKKLNLGSFAELIKYAVRQGLTHL